MKWLSGGGVSVTNGMTLSAFGSIKQHYTAREHRGLWLGQRGSFTWQSMTSCVMRSGKPGTRRCKWMSTC